jgi:hypothetical protein
LPHVLRATYRLMMLNICAGFFATPLASDSYGADKLFGTISLHFTLRYNLATRFLQIINTPSHYCDHLF